MRSVLDLAVDYRQTRQPRCERLALLYLSGIAFSCCPLMTLAKEILFHMVSICSDWFAFFKSASAACFEKRIHD
jgi:hypothetical protein